MDISSAAISLHFLPGTFCHFITDTDNQLRRDASARAIQPMIARSGRQEDCISTLPAVVGAENAGIPISGLPLVMSIRAQSPPRRAPVEGRGTTRRAQPPYVR